MKNFYKKNKTIINILILLVVTALVLFLALKDDFEEIINHIKTMNYLYLSIAFLAVIFYWLIRSLALHTFTKKIKKDNKYRSSLQVMLRTQFFNAVTPFSTGGQPYQIYYLTQQGMETSIATNVIIQNFIVYQIALVFLGIIAVVYNFFFPIFSKVPLLRYLVLLGFLINTVVIIVMFIVSFSTKMNKKLISFGISILTKLHLVKDKEKKLEEWDQHINEFHRGALILLENKWDFIKTILYNLVALIFLYSIPVFILFAMGDFSSVSIFNAVMTSAYVMLVGSFVPVPGASGGIEFGFISFYGQFVGGAKLKTVMLIWRFITYYFGLIVGSIALNMKRVK